MALLVVSCNSTKKLEEPKYNPAPIPHLEPGDIKALEPSDSLAFIEENK